ncbi:MAG: DUF5694 domain-containing protein [Bacteroidota bacterium]
MLRFSILLFTGLALSCTSSSKKTAEEPTKANQETVPTDDKVQVLNFATFHMGASSDANTVEFDEENQKNQQDAKAIAELFSAFKPTVICVEVPPSKNDELNENYRVYLKTPKKASTYYGEVGLVAFEVGRRNNIARLHGIDHKMEYNYNINSELTNLLDSITYNKFQADPLASVQDINPLEEEIPLVEKLKRINHPRFLDFLITANADVLTHVGTENGFEGADEAAKYYQRNPRIYANLNRIPLDSSDRVFILSGGSHTAFLNGFLKRSLKYEVVDTFEYLK